MILQNASHNGTAEASYHPDDFFEGLDELLKQWPWPPETGESQHIRTNDPEQFPVNPCDAAQQLSVSDLSQKDSSNKKERKRKRIEHNDERK